jgi:hypothetical protein
MSAWSFDSEWAWHETRPTKRVAPPWPLVAIARRRRRRRRSLCLRLL